jgi:hypothetical protein
MKTRARWWFSALVLAAIVLFYGCADYVDCAKTGLCGAAGAGGHTASTGAACSDTVDSGVIPPKCTPDNWCWVQPAPVGFNFNAVWGRCDGVWVVGQSGTIMHKDAAGWQLFPQSPTTSDLYAVFGFTATDVWAGGDALYHYNGEQWTASYEPPSATQFLSIWGAAPDDVWAAGLSGGNACNQVFMHWDGMHWERQPAVEGLNASLDQITGSAANDVWAAGSGVECGGQHLGQLLHWDGKSWMSTSLPSGLMVTIVSEPSPGDVWIAGYAPSSSQIWHGTPGNWSQQKVSISNINAIFGSSSTDVWVATNDVGSLSHFDGTSWSQPQLPAAASDAAFLAGWSVGSTTTILVGNAGTIVQRESNVFVAADEPFPFMVSGAWGPSSSDVWFVGTNEFQDAQGTGQRAMALHVGGPGSPTVEPLMGADVLNAVTGDGTSNGVVSPVWVVGSSAQPKQTAAAWHFSGGAAGSWAGPYTMPQPGVGSTMLNGVYYDGKQMWAVGDGPSIYNNAAPTTPGTGWTASSLPSLPSVNVPFPALYSVAGTSMFDVWAVGDVGMILHWDGQAWSLVQSNTSAQLTSVFATSTGSAWAAGSDSSGSVVLLSWDGMKWTPVTAPKAPFPSLPAIWSDSNDLWLYTGTTLYQEPGKAGPWTQVGVPAGLAGFVPSALWGTPNANQPPTLWMGGYGTIRRYR